MRIFSKKHSDATHVPRRRSELLAEDQFAYRRNRTFTGTASSVVASANEVHSELRSPRVEAHILRRKRRHVSLMITVLLLGAGILWHLMSQVIIVPSVQVLRADIYTRSTKNVAGYERALGDYLNARPLERFGFSLNKTNLLANLQTAYPEIERITIDHMQVGMPTQFVITPRMPLAAWTIDNEKQYVDKNGVAYKANYYDEPPVGIIDESGLPHSGKTVASGRFLGFIGKVLGYSKQFGYQAVQITLPYHTTRQIKIQYANVPYPVILSADRPAGEQVEDMVRIARYASAHQLSLEYLDVRVSGHGYYKTKE